jgi:hypothetical protein
MEIAEKLKGLGIIDTQIRSVIDRMEDQSRQIKGSTTGNLENYSFEVVFSKTKSGLSLDDVRVL